MKTEVVAGTEGDGLDEDADQPEAEEKIPDVNSTLLSDMLDVKAYWLSSPNLADKLGPSHFRRILECSCGGLEVSNGVRFVRISITGESFMVHQVEFDTCIEIFFIGLIARIVFLATTQTLLSSSYVCCILTGGSCR